MWLCFARHGQTDDNVRGIIQGHKDTPLNDHGRCESSRLAERLASIPFTEAHSSPLSRARETAEIVLRSHPRIRLNQPAQLKERCLGSMEGRRRAKGEKAPADAESYQSMMTRQSEWFDALLAAHEPPDPLPRQSFLSRVVPRSSTTHSHSSHQHTNAEDQDTDDEIILVCSHGAWLGTFLSLLLSNRYKFKLERGVDPRLHCLNTSIMLVHCNWRDGRWKGSICSWGDVDHLKDMMDEEVRDVADDI